MIDNWCFLLRQILLVTINGDHKNEDDSKKMFVFVHKGLQNAMMVSVACGDEVLYHVLRWANVEICASFFWRISCWKAIDWDLVQQSKLLSCSTHETELWQDRLSWKNGPMSLRFKIWTSDYPKVFHFLFCLQSSTFNQIFHLWFMKPKWWQLVLRSGEVVSSSQFSFV